jgi:ATP-dependent helicase/nuclease subunit B
MSATAVTSAVNHRRIRRARAWLESRELAEEVVIVGASLDAANELGRRVAKEKGAAFGWHRITLSQLAAAIAAPALATLGLVTLSRLGTEAIVARVVHRLKAEGELSRYHAVAATPGFPRAVAGVIAELRLARLPSDAIDSVIPDLGLLIGAYEAELAEASLTDWPGVLALATEAASGNGANRHRLIGLPMLLLDLPVGSAAELAFVRALAATAPDMLVTVPAADEPTIRRIRDGLRLQIEDLDETPSSNGRAAAAGTGGLANLQRYLFSESARPSEANPDDEVAVFSAPGEGRECVEIARRVLSLARRGIPFDRIAVLLRSPEGYRANLEEALNRADIPAHFARGAVRPDPAGRAFCALLKCAAEGLSARRFAEYLSLGQVPDAAPGGAPPEADPRGDRWVAPDPELIPPFTTEEVSEPAGPVETSAWPAKSFSAARA